jgi:hypothetical protein
VNLFLDTRLILAACASTTGASSEVCRRADSHGWSLIVTSYVIAEVEANLPDLGSEAQGEWKRLREQLELRDDIFTLDRPTIFGPAKDRPILFSALAWADVLLTLDRADFGALMGQQFYGLRILRPGSFLEQERAAGRFR